MLQASNLNVRDKSWAPVFTLDMKAKNCGLRRNHNVICMSVQQASVPKVAVSPLELENATEPPLNLHKPKEPYTATIVSVERLVGPKAPGETCHIVINHDGNVPYWEGQSYGVIPPVSDLLTILILCFYCFFLNPNIECEFIMVPF
jgi:ferredoxin--NADP+ reductase